MMPQRECDSENGRVMCTMRKSLGLLPCDADARKEPWWKSVKAQATENGYAMAA